MDKTRLDPASAQKLESTPTGAESSSNVPESSRRNGQNVELSRGPRKLILCFDGTGNKFHGDDSDSNILKIFRMLDRTADDQYHYYQRKTFPRIVKDGIHRFALLTYTPKTAGIGTYVVSGSLTHSSARARINSWYTKAKDSAVGSSFDQHVVGGYRFLMRFYNPGDEIYMFGFSRGAYIARFLAEMLDYIGLLSHGNEEMVRFAWKAFSQWQCRQNSGGNDDEDKEVNKKTQAEEEKKRKMYEFMKGFRETFSRPVGRIRFLGLFDTVNSVPRFETAWMQRSKFPYTARSSAKVIRHAVSIDERRAKFRQDLMYQGNPKTKDKKHRQLGDWFGLDYMYPRRASASKEVKNPEAQSHANEERENKRNGAETNGHGQRGRDRQPKKQTSQYLTPRKSRTSGDYAPYRVRSRSKNRPVTPQQQEKFLLHPEDAMSGTSGYSNYDDDEANEESQDGQDIDEVWFAGGHADIGGGWEMLEDRKAASHIPLVWIVREAMRAGLPFDPEKVAEMGCSCSSHWEPHNPSRRHPDVKKNKKNANIPDIHIRSDSQPDDLQEVKSEHEDEKADINGDGVIDEEDEMEVTFRNLLGKSHTARIHDSLSYGGGLPWMAVSAWKFMEWLPFRRMDLLPDGSWEPIRWPLPRGEVRDVPHNVRVHGSVIRRMQDDGTYRPGNLIIGGGGRGVRVAPAEKGIGKWVCVAEKGDPIGEIWMREQDDDNKDEEE